MTDRQGVYLQLKVYTIGHGNRALGSLVDLLKARSMQTLADIRSYPRSKRNPHFNHDFLKAELPRQHIAYVWFKGLGGYRKTGLGPESPHVALKSRGFRNYADHMLTEAFREDIDRLSELIRRANTCLMCAEALPFRCHRWLLSDYLVANGIQVIHIIDVEQTIAHEISKYSRIQEGNLFYDYP